MCEAEAVRIPLGFLSGDTFTREQLWAEPRFVRDSHPSDSTDGRRGTNVKCCPEPRSFHCPGTAQGQLSCAGSQLRHRGQGDRDPATRVVLRGSGSVRHPRAPPRCNDPRLCTRSCCVSLTLPAATCTLLSTCRKQAESSYFCPHSRRGSAAFPPSARVTHELLPGCWSQQHLRGPSLSQLRQ